MTNGYRFPASKGVAASALLIATLGAAAPAPPSCKQELLAAYRKLGGKQRSSEQVFHLRFTSKAVYNAPGQRPPRQTLSHGELYSVGSKGFFQTDDISVWQDGRYVATVLHAQRTVYVTRSAPGRTLADASRAFLLRDTLIQVGRAEPCTLVREGKQTLQHIRLNYTGAVASRLGIQNLEFWLAPAQTVQRMSIGYRPGAMLQRAVVEFAVQEWLTASAKIPIDARRQVLDARGNLLPAFAGYSLVDQTTRSPGAR